MLMLFVVVAVAVCLFVCLGGLFFVCLFFQFILVLILIFLIIIFFSFFFFFFPRTLAVSFVSDWGFCLFVCFVVDLFY